MCHSSKMIFNKGFSLATNKVQSFQDQEYKPTKKKRITNTLFQFKVLKQLISDKRQAQKQQIRNFIGMAMEI